MSGDLGRDGAHAVDAGKNVAPAGFLVYCDFFGFSALKGEKAGSPETVERRVDFVLRFGGARQLRAVAQIGIAFRCRLVARFAAGFFRWRANEKSSGSAEDGVDLRLEGFGRKWLHDVVGNPLLFGCDDFLRLALRRDHDEG